MSEADRTRLPEYVIRRSRRRTLALHLLPDGSVEVRAPLRYPLKDIERFVRERIGWIDRKRKEQALSTARVLWSEGPITPETRVHVRGVAHLVLPIARRRSTDLPYTVETGVPGSPPSLVVPVVLHPTPESLRSAASEPVRTTIVRMYRRIAEEHLAEILPTAIERIGASPTAITFRMQRSRWGSCNRAGRISLNLLCAALPDPLFEYILYHELCHLVHLDHGSGFWKKMLSVMPDTKERRAGLRGWRLR